MNHCSCESQKALLTLKTAKGQIEGIIRMIEEDRYCVDVSRQILSVMALLKKANLVILKQHLDTCITEAVLQGEGSQKSQEIMNILETYVG